MMTTMNTTPMSQLTFAWAESEPAVSLPTSLAPQTIKLGVAAPVSSEKLPSRKMERQVSMATQPKEARLGRPEHISDLLLVVLDRYGISPDEFLAGLQ